MEGDTVTDFEDEDMHISESHYSAYHMNLSDTKERNNDFLFLLLFS